MSEQVATPPAASPEDAPRPAEPTADGQATESTVDGQGPEPAEADGEQPEAKRSATRKVVGVVGAVLAVGVVAALKFGLGTAVAAAFHEDGTADAKAGDCLAELPEVADGESKDVSGAEIVPCTSTKAVYTVAGRVDAQSEAQARTGDACKQFLQPGQEGYFFYNVKPGSTGYLLCLTKRA
ncbi:hypothetical protein ACFY2R_17240 [Micromonospora olivasterospora]|uniref:Uncharacterized protein n=1 Tax=Micromonospora olivasterospora TaxID=1880 RepID=A0A562ICI3_MICOL|nr:hypothetical protein [Micromonospora olivasterospora]TWH68423.1 hypothetical protein JD77_03415 [Micromonospora olivasterospora]